MIGWFCAAEHNHCARGEHVGSTAPSATDSIDDRFEVLKITHADVSECIRVAGERERGDQFRKVADGIVNLSDLGAWGKAQLDEGLDSVTQLMPVHLHGVSADHPDGFEPIDAALGGGRR